MRRKSFGMLLFLSIAWLGLAPSPTLARDQPATADVAQGVEPDYLLGPGDRLKVITFGEDELTGEFSVGPDGYVAVPLVGGVKASGLTIRQFERAVEQAEAPRYVSNPHVSVEVLTYRPFFILGEVNHPGQFPYVKDMTILDAVATASGFTYRANTHAIKLKRAGERAEHVVKITPGTVISPGDTIVVGERFF